METTCPTSLTGAMEQRRLQDGMDLVQQRQPRILGVEQEPTPSKPEPKTPTTHGAAGLQLSAYP